MVFFHEFLFPLGFSLLVFVILVKYHSLYFTVTDSDNKKKGFCTKDLAREHGDEKSKELRVVGEKMVEENEQNVKFSEFAVESLYFVEKVAEEPDFLEIESNPSEKNGKFEGENGKKKDEGLLFEDWEGIERTELEKMFGAAVVFVDSMKKNAEMVFDSELKMQLYGLHKVATEGACYDRKPMAFNRSARAKWSSWHRLGDMSREKAMEQYVALLSDRVADWKIDKSDANYELVSREVQTYQDSRHFCNQVSRKR